MSIRPRVCRECGKAFEGRSMSALFCSATCRGLFNKRRRDRGAELYDFVMVAYPTTHPLVWRLVEQYLSADKVLRAGRPSYQSEITARSALPAVYGECGDGR